MRKLIGSVVLAAALVTLPAVAAAQAHGGGAAKHEFGVDLAFAYYSPSDLGGFSFEKGVQIVTPVDLRVGFVSGEKLTIEPRLSFLFDSKGGVDTTSGEATSGFVLTPKLSVLYGFQGNKAGPYVRVGAGINLVDGGSESASQISFHGGLGTRTGYGSGTFRPEFFVQYLLKNEDKGLPNEFQIGALLGLSLWH
ncbi:MAG: hypothetical protein ACRDHF_11150 [Tepidiformaceae bacterium]